MVQSAANESSDSGGSTGGGVSERAFAEDEYTVPTNRSGSGEGGQEGAGGGRLHDAAPRTSTDDEFVIGEFGRGPAGEAGPAEEAAPVRSGRLSERSGSDDEFGGKKEGQP